ncbi:MAG: RsmB/NOP family class I SAM-dependent RNA methyltransferase [Thermoprotei archaeon]|nr:RsmB/NOP family class I SAM-dependent RNA methyltransferase [Thermoprotei archaeon]
MEYDRFLARVAYGVLRLRVSVDVAFKRACRGVCAGGVDERERLYDMARRFISDYVKVSCIAGPGVKPRDLARLWLSNPNLEVGEPYCRLSVSKWVYDKLSSLMGEGEAYTMLEAANKRVWWLRINTLKASVESVARSLESEGVEFEVDPRYYYMVRVKNSPKPVRLLKAVREFKAIPQDIASAAVVEALNPQPGDSILDACAAPGIKTSLIAMLTEGKTRITAVDISGRRVAIMRKLMRKLGVPDESLEIIVGDSRKLEFKGRHDKALIDAPCSNSGAIAKDPGLKITLTEGKIRYYSRLQKEILANIASHADKITYATCSLMPEEGEEIALYAEETLGAKLEKPNIKICRPGYRGYRVSDSICRLYPHIHESEGFIIANIIP